MTTSNTLDPLTVATQQIVADITARYANAQATNRIPDIWELVGLAVQLIETPIPGVPKLTGVHKMSLVKQIVAAVVQQLPIQSASKEHLQQTLFKIQNLVEVSLQLLERHEKLQRKCTGCFGSTPEKVIIPFELIKQ